jgi:Mg-chelatase subunit ChlD
MNGLTLRRLSVSALLTFGLTLPASAASAATTPASNPNLGSQTSCGLDFTLVLDRSASVSGSSVKAAAYGFLDELAGTGSTISLVSFAETATVDIGATPLSAGANLDAMKAAVNGLSFGGYTNWDDALRKAQDSFGGFTAGRPPLVVIVTDGVPNRYISNSSGDVRGSGTGLSQTALDHAVEQANLIKGLGTRVFTVGVGGSQSVNTTSLQAISGMDQFSGVNIETADWTTVDSVAGLSAELKRIATDLCNESVVVHRTAGTAPLAGSEFTATGGGSVVTGDDGVATFSWKEPSGVTTTISETPRSDFPLESVQCTLDGSPIGIVSGNAVTLTVGPQDTIECMFSSVAVTPAGGGGGDGGGGGGTGAPAPGAANAGLCPSVSSGTRSGYWMLGSDGAVYAFGGSAYLGRAILGGAPAVDIEVTPTGNGYWILDSAGRVYRFGDAGAFAPVTTSGLAAGETFTSISATPTGNGYWLFTTGGRALPIGDAVFHGDMSGTPLNGPVFDSIPTPSGKGYYMVASDGGIFSFGDAVFYGSMGGKRLNAPVQSLVPDPDCKGYWLVASDGGVFAFESPFQGSMGDVKLNKPVNGMVPFGNGYLMVANDGGIFNFSNLPFFGSLGSNPPQKAIVAVTALDV